MLKVMNHLNKSKLIFDKSVYKYGVYKTVLQELYPSYTDYKLKKVFDQLLNHKYINKVECHKSFKYQFNGCNLFNTKINERYENYVFDENDKIILVFE